MITPTADEQLRALGRVIRDARRARDLSQEAVAGAAGVHPNQVGRLERGEADVYTSTMLRIVEGIGVSLSDLARAYETALAGGPA
ncbi:MAG TPA: helix-turn-helix transcriptional regulator [Conexibacter sp.]|nr:helix-turn-helix transcriptional regulator [Conexibacter sp.]